MMCTQKTPKIQRPGVVYDDCGEVVDETMVAPTPDAILEMRAETLIARVVCKYMAMAKKPGMSDFADLELMKALKQIRERYLEPLKL